VAVGEAASEPGIQGSLRGVRLQTYEAVSHVLECVAGAVRPKCARSGYATAHLGVGIKRNLGVRLAVDIVDRRGGAAVFPYVGINFANSSQLSPIEGVVGALTPLLAVVIGEVL
jgi:hypothetical protein